MTILSSLKEKLKNTSIKLDKKIKNIFSGSASLKDEDIESLEEMLIESDIGVENSVRIASIISEKVKSQSIDEKKIRNLLKEEILNILSPVAIPIPIFTSSMQVILVVGVNGSGKTTTIGKLSSQFRSSGKSVTIVAADTFRAAAVEQLKEWGKRSDTRVFSCDHGKDPSALVFEAISDALEKKDTDILLVDTAGRLANRKDLMDELSKIIRTIKKLIPDAPHNTILVLDANSGQNILEQVKLFRQAANITGLIMTKLDGTAKGGSLVAIAGSSDRLPIHAIGVGEAIDDLRPFDAQEFCCSLISI